MKNIFNLFKNRLNILFCLVPFLLFTHTLTANEPTEKPTNQEFKQKTAKLHMPFIANNGQMDEQVKFYAKTFGGTVFVTNAGEIVYSLPANSSECRGEWHSPNGIHDEAGMLHDHHISDIVHPASWIIEHDKPEFRNPKHVASGVEPSETCGEQSRTIQNLKSGIALREEFVGSKVKAIQGEQPSVTKVSYFKGNDPSKWNTNISTYDAVNLGEIYDGIELKLRAYGNNVEKLFCVKPGAAPETIQLKLSGVKALKINKDGQLEVRTELGAVKFTRPVAYQEIEGRRVEVECKYSIADCGMQNAEITHPLVPSREEINPKPVVSEVEPSKIQNLSSTSIGDPKS